MILLPIVDADGQVGLVVVRRAIEPFAGELALPGGFIESGESWQEALVRELREETGLLAVPSDVRLFDVHSSYNGHSLLIFGLLPIRPLETLPACTPNDEVSEWLVLNHAQQLAFPTHTEAMADFFAGLAVVDAATQ